MNFFILDFGWKTHLGSWFFEFFDSKKMPSLWAFYWCWKKFHSTIWSVWTHWTGGTGQYTSRELQNKHHLYTKSLLQNHEFSKSSLGLNPLWGQNIQKFSLPKNSPQHGELTGVKIFLLRSGHLFSSLYIYTLSGGWTFVYLLDVLIYFSWVKQGCHMMVTSSACSLVY